MVFQLQPPAQDLHHAAPQNPTRNKRCPPPKKKIRKLYHIAILVPHDELVMKSYMHVGLAIVATHYHNLNANILTEGPQLTLMKLFYKHVRNHDQARGLREISKNTE
jgi:hypothetical protein